MSALPARTDTDAGHPVPVVFAAALRGSACHVEWADTTTTPLPVRRWRRTADTSDRAVLAHCAGDTLDVGCGPGRMAEHLAARGHGVLALDIVPEALSQAAARGLPTWLGDVFAPIPREGEWDTALLADGNIGIGGDPVALLTRLRSLLRRGGRVVVDLEAPGGGVRTEQVRLSTGDHASHAFPWSTVAVDAVEPLAAAAGFGSVERHCVDDRWFAVLDGGA